jgi:small subunit ribosomal protein S16
MSVQIRMQRAGGRNAPFYRVVVADSRRARDGRFLEKIGYYNPLTQPAQVHMDQERVRYWVKNGAQMSESVNALWKKFGGKLEEPAAPAASETA